MARAKHQRVKRFAYILIAIGLICLLLSWWIYNRQPRQPYESYGVKSIAIETAPSSIKPAPATVASYNVAPTLPKYIAIPAIGIVNTPVIQLRLMANGQISTPDNIYETGWYNGSAKPGQPGAMFIYGHVSSWTADGIFYNLKELKAGDKVTVTRGDNQMYIYQVVDTKVYPYNDVDMQTVLSPVNANKPGLNLMTCTGQVIRGTSEFNERLVVFTTLVSS